MILASSRILSFVRDKRLFILALIESDALGTLMIFSNFAGGVCFWMFMLSTLPIAVFRLCVENESFRLADDDTELFKFWVEPLILEFNFTAKFSILEAKLLALDSRSLLLFSELVELDNFEFKLFGVALVPERIRPLVWIQFDGFELSTFAFVFVRSIFDSFVRVSCHFVSFSLWSLFWICTLKSSSEFNWNGSYQIKFISKYY